MQSAQEKNKLPKLKTWLAFKWFCKECGSVNDLNYDVYICHKGIAECYKCERVVELVPPWDGGNAIHGDIER